MGKSKSLGRKVKLEYCDLQDIFFYLFRVDLGSDTVEIY